MTNDNFSSQEGTFLIEKHEGRSRMKDSMLHLK